MTDKDVAGYVQALYSGTGTWDYLDDGAHDDGVYWALKMLPDCVLVILRGSVTRQDWERDFQAFTLPFNHSGLGPVHPGFLAGMEEMRDELFEMLGPPPWKPVIVAGHSLGAGRACILTGLMVLEAMPPALRLCWGEPKPGFLQLGNSISAVKARSYRNFKSNLEHDYVTDVPVTDLFERYCHPAALTDVCVEPDAEANKWGAFRWHHMPLYVQATPAVPIVLP
jgi:hypothetical protein